MSHYWFDPVVRTKVDELAIIGTLCSSMVTMEEARFSARTKKDLTFLTDLHIKTFFWLPFDEETEQNVADIHTALWKIGAGARRTKNRHPHRRHGHSTRCGGYAQRHRLRDPALRGPGTQSPTRCCVYAGQPERVAIVLSGSPVTPGAALPTSHLQSETHAPHVALS